MAIRDHKSPEEHSDLLINECRVEVDSASSIAFGPSTDYQLAELVKSQALCIMKAKRDYCNSIGKKEDAEYFNDCCKYIEKQDCKQ